MADAGRMHHDMGGKEAGPVEKAAHSHPDWEKRVDALMMLLSNKTRRLIGVDEMRRGIESLGAERFPRLSAALAEQRPPVEEMFEHMVELAIEGVAAFYGVE